MVAPPSVRGERVSNASLAAMAVYAAAMGVGAVTLAAALRLIGNVVGRLPLVGVGAAALLAVLWAAGVIVLPLPESAWAVPQGWSRFGRVAYAGLFGFVLGLGILTRVAAVGFYILLLYGLSDARWAEIWPVFALFAAARALPLLVIVVTARNRREYPDRSISALSRIASLSSPLEAATLAALGMFLLVASRGIWAP